MEQPRTNSTCDGGGLVRVGGMLATGLSSEHAASKFWLRHNHKAMGSRDRSRTVFGLNCNSSRTE
jgi:hypothetical protein